MIYLDHNATTYIYPEVKQVMLEVMDRPLNPSAVHSYGREGASIIEQARRTIAKLLEIELKEYQIIFTSSGTEANNLLINNYVDGEIFISAIEHASIFKQQSYNNNIKLINVTERGIVDLRHLEFLLSNSENPRKLVSVMLANNETGIIQPVKKVIELAKKYKANTHSDCVQAIGKIPCDIGDLNVDFATISAHKFGGPIGTGALVAKLSMPLRAQMIGGGQERGLRSGTVNVTGISGFGVAAGLAKQQIENNAKIQSLRDKLENGVLNICPTAKIVGRNEQRLPNTSMIIMPRVESQLQLIAFDLRNIAVSAGSACSSGKANSPYALTAMGICESEARCAVRISLGREQDENDIVRFLSAWEEIYLKSKVGEENATSAA